MGEGGGTVTEAVVAMDEGGDTVTEGGVTRG